MSNEHHGLSNHWQLNSLFNNLFRLTATKIKYLQPWSFVRGIHANPDNGPVMWEVPSWSPIARFMGPTWGPPGADRIQVGPMLAPWTLLCGIPPWLMTDHPTLLVWLGLGLLIVHFGGSVQKRRNSSALAMELNLSCTDPSIWSLFYFSCTSIFLMQHFFILHCVIKEGWCIYSVILFTFGYPCVPIPCVWLYNICTWYSLQNVFA